MGSLLAIYDPSGKLGLTDPSPGGGTMPVRVGPGWRGDWDGHHHAGWQMELGNESPQCKRALVLRTEDGTRDPIGMARAREVLARVVGLDPSEGVVFTMDREHEWWVVGVSFEANTYPTFPDESAPEALARLLSEHAGVEVVRG